MPKKKAPVVFDPGIIQVHRRSRWVIVRILNHLIKTQFGRAGMIRKIVVKLQARLEKFDCVLDSSTYAVNRKRPAKSP